MTKELVAGTCGSDQYEVPKLQNVIPHLKELSSITIPNLCPTNLATFNISPTEMFF